MQKDTTPLLKSPPQRAAIVCVLMQGPPPYVQIDLFHPTEPGAIMARYTARPENVAEAASAFEILLNGTVWGQPQTMTGMEFPAYKVT